MNKNIKLIGIEPEFELCGPKVAVVGNSPILLGSGYGSDIDAHDEVIRFNGAITDGFAADVGSRTSICCVAIDIAFIFTQPFNHPLWKKGTEYDEDTLNLVREYNAEKFISVFPDAVFFLFRPVKGQFWKIAGHYIPKAISDAGSQHRYHFFDVSSEHFLDSAKATNQRLEKIGLVTRMRFGGPRTGFKMVLRLILSGVRPTLYGFDVDPTLNTAQHYYDNVTCEHLDSYKDHDIRLERDAIAELANLGYVDLKS